MKETMSSVASVSIIYVWTLGMNGNISRYVNRVVQNQSYRVTVALMFHKHILSSFMLIWITKVLRVIYQMENERSGPKKGIAWENSSLRTLSEISCSTETQSNNWWRQYNFPSIFCPEWTHSLKIAFKPCISWFV